MLRTLIQDTVVLDVSGHNDRLGNHGLILERPAGRARPLSSRQPASYSLSWRSM